MTNNQKNSKNYQIKLSVVKNYNQIAQVKSLFREYGATRIDDPALFDFQQEISNLPGDYAPPSGTIITANFDDQPIGCVALRKLSDDICEMKRLYVSPQFRRKGIGVKLSYSIIEHAKRMNYQRMRLDSIPSMSAAKALYLSLGFYEISAYRQNPNEDTKYFEKLL